jgi:hypothetical protein
VEIYSFPPAQLFRSKPAVFFMLFSEKSHDSPGMRHDSREAYVANDQQLPQLL